VALADYHAELGDKAAALALVGEVVALDPTDPLTLFRLAVFSEYRLARRDDALKWLSRAIERGQTWRQIDRSPQFAALRDDERFRQLRQQADVGAKRPE
jgi:hypothetical protein